MPRTRWLRPGTRLPLFLILVMIAIAVVGPFLAPYDPHRSETGAFHRPDTAHLLGTDDLGRDVLSRVLASGWPVLVTPLVAVIAAGVIGVGIGLLLVTRRGRGRQAVQLLDVVLAVPPILFLIMLAYVLPPGWWTLVIITVVINAPFTARFVRSLADGYFDAGFVEVSLVEGRRRTSIAAAEILPNLWTPLLGELGNRFVFAMYILVTAGFLGLSPLGRGGDWASMITDSLGGIMLNPAAVIAPALCIGVVAVSVNLLADQWRARE